MRIAIVTDAWLPQTNGVVRTLQHTRRCLEAQGHTVCMITPEGSHTFPLPTYPDIRLALRPRARVRRVLENFDPEHLHIATEGPLGFAARKWCLVHGLHFTTSYHTQFPYYIRMRFPFPIRWTYRALRWFHGAAARTLVPTRGQYEDLEAHGFENLAVWGRGVETDLFTPGNPVSLQGERPYMMYMGRVAVEKNIEDFLSLDRPGTKYVVGDGPSLEELRERYPDAVFTGARYGRELAATLAAADVFVFPSRTDTFGLVMLEAMACGLPVAAYPVTGPLDVVTNGVTGVLDEDLGRAIDGALTLDPQACRRQAEQRSWEAATEQFASCLVRIRGPVAPIPRQPVPSSVITKH